MAARPSAKELRTFVHEPEARSQLVDRLVELLLYGTTASAAALVFLIATGLMVPTDIPFVGPRIYAALDFPGTQGLLYRSGAAAGSVLVALIAINLVLRPYRRFIPGPRKIVVAADDRGIVLVSPSSVCAVAVAPVQRLPGVVSVKASLIGRDTAPLRLTLDIDVVPDVALPDIGDKAREAAANAVSEFVGIKVQAVLVNFKVVEAAKLSRALQ